MARWKDSAHLQIVHGRCYNARENEKLWVSVEVDQVLGGYTENSCKEWIGGLALV